MRTRYNTAPHPTKPGTHLPAGPWRVTSALLDMPETDTVVYRALFIFYLGTVFHFFL